MNPPPTPGSKKPNQKHLQQSSLRDKWPLHLTAIALLVGMSVAIASLAREGSTVNLIMIAQALTVLGIPALAAALIYLGTRKELQSERSIPKGIIIVASIGFCVSCVLAGMTAVKVYGKLNPPSPPAQTASVEHDAIKI